MCVPRVRVGIFSLFALRLSLLSSSPSPSPSPSLPFLLHPPPLSSLSLTPSMAEEAVNALRRAVCGGKRVLAPMTNASDSPWRILWWAASLACNLPESEDLPLCQSGVSAVVVSEERREGDKSWGSTRLSSSLFSSLSLSPLRLPERRPCCLRF